MKTETTDTLRRNTATSLGFDELAAFKCLPETVQKCLVRAATSKTRKTAILPVILGEGWLMVPTARGARQVATDGDRAWAL